MNIENACKHWVGLGVTSFDKPQNKNETKIKLGSNK